MNEFRQRQRKSAAAQFYDIASLPLDCPDAL
jgi:hypothetical protein